MEGSVSSKRFACGGGAALDTVTVTGADVVRLPAASRATAVIVCGPSLDAVVSTETEYGAVRSSAASATPSPKNCTPTTPTLSAALADNVTVPLSVPPFAGAVMFTVGGVVSAGGPLATVTVTGADVVLLPAASRATAVMVCGPLLVVVVSMEIEYGALRSSAASAIPSPKNCTPTTPTLSAALAASVTVPLTVAPFAGAVMPTVGGVVSGGGPLFTVTVTALEVVALPAASRATAVMLCEPLLVPPVFQETE